MLKSEKGTFGEIQKKAIVNNEMILTIATPGLSALGVTGGLNEIARLGRKIQSFLNKIPRLSFGYRSTHTPHSERNDNILRSIESDKSR